MEEGDEDDAPMELVTTRSKRKARDREEHAANQQQKAARSLEPSTQTPVTCQAAAQQVPCDTPAVIYVKTTDGKSMNTNPLTLNKALNESPLGKYILQGHVRALGTGTALRVEVVHDYLSKLTEPLEKITTLGPWAVKCWESKQLNPDLFYGKVGPFEGTYTAESLFKDHGFLYHSAGATLTEVVPFPPMADGTRFFRLAFEGARLPKDILLGNQVIRVTEYKMPALRCRNCYQFGHGTLACRSKVRCTNCSGYHPFVSPEGDRCSREPFRYFCQEGHRLNNRSCPALLKANEINEQCREGKLDRIETLEKLREVTPKKAPTIAEGSSLTNHQSAPRPAPPTAPPIVLNNSYAILSDLSDDEFDSTSVASPTTLTHTPHIAQSLAPYTPLRRRTRRKSTGNTPARHHTLTSTTHPTADIQVHHPADPPQEREMPSVRPKHPQAQTFATVVTGESPKQQKNTSSPPQDAEAISELDWYSILTRTFDILFQGLALYQKGTSFFEIIRRLTPALLALFNV